jgi:hypothetical protein
MSDFCFYRQELPSGGNVLFFKYVPGPARLLKESYRLRRLLPAPETVREVRVIASKKDRARALEQLARVWLPLCTPAAGPRPTKRGFQCAACWQAWSLKKKIYRVQAIGISEVFLSDGSARDATVAPPFTAKTSGKKDQLHRTDITGSNVDTKSLKKILSDMLKGFKFVLLTTPKTIIKYLSERYASQSEIQKLKDTRRKLKEQVSRNTLENIQITTTQHQDIAKYIEDATKLVKKYQRNYELSLLVHLWIFIDLVIIQKTIGFSITPEVYRGLVSFVIGMVAAIRKFIKMTYI